jgi:hypothetical protein
MIDAHSRLKPLPIVIGQRYGRDRQAENLARHPGYTIKTFACWGIQQF